MWFEVLLYLSLTLDAVSVAFQDRTPKADMTEQMIMVATLMAAGLILLLVYFVRLAARERKNWPRWVLAAALVLSVISLVQVIGANGLQLDSAIEVVSCALTAAGLYFPSPAMPWAGSTRRENGLLRRFAPRQRFAFVADNDGIGSPMTLPRNVVWFEVLLYLSLTLDAVSVAFQDRTPKADMTEQMIMVVDPDGGRPDPAAGLFRPARGAGAQELAALGAGRGAGAVGDLAGAGDRRRTACNSTAPSRWCPAR